MTTLNNIEKMIQMATIEQMYNMLQKMRSESNENNIINENNVDNNSDNDSINTCHAEVLNHNIKNVLKHVLTVEALCNAVDTRSNDTFKILDTTTRVLSTTVDVIAQKFEQFTTHIQMLSDKIDRLQSVNSVNLLQGQTKITDYYSENTECNDNEEVVKPELVTTNNIELKVEEKLIKEDTCSSNDKEHINNKVEDEQSVIEEDYTSSESEVATDDEEVVDEHVNDNKANENEEQCDPKEEVNEATNLEEEETLEDSNEVEEECSGDTVEDDETESEEEGEEEEVFEIEIDDVTYYVIYYTPGDEENGTLYEVDKDGEVGKKIGIIKDGEPIFDN